LEIWPKTCEVATTKFHQLGNYKNAPPRGKMVKS